MSNLTGRICVFTGSRHGARSEYAEAAKRLGRELVARGYGLVYGGGKVGLMTVIADTVLELKGHVTGVIPSSLVSKEVAHLGLTALRVVDSMHERKALMAELSDGFIAMPGGIGTMEELFEVFSWAQLGLHEKPCALLNVAAYYDPLIQFLDRAVEQDFIKTKHRALLIVESDPGVLLDRFAELIAVKPVEKFDAKVT
ncbi:MAG TPA: TIGR00730 family Rossman fold protein [Candidatus Limnocylindria bacterium]|nr:TIGR00730 family Rossman fold protein [Candidatus Limnocylindria bacterium]